MPGQVGHKDEGAPEDADQQGTLPRVVLADLLPQLGDPLLESLLPDQNVVDVISHVGHSISSPFLWLIIRTCPRQG